MTMDRPLLPLVPPAGERLAPFPFYADRRRRHPVAYDGGEGIWAVYRYAEVRRVLADSDTFSSNRGLTNRPRLAFPDRVPDLVNSDGARHRQLRDPIARFFTPASVARLEPRVSELVHRLLDRVVPTGRLDVVRDLADPLPLTLSIELLGIPPEDRERFLGWWSRWLVWRNERPPYRRNIARRRPGPWAEELDVYLRRLATQRVLEPRGDVLSTLVAMEVGGERLREEEILDGCALFLVAGHVPVTYLISSTVLTLLEHPEVLRRLRAEPAALPAAIEEVVRYRSPVQAVSRVPRRDTELAGAVIREGEEVIAWIGSANRDEARFDEPDRFDVDRHPNPHLGFGVGSHFCFGAPLARLQARTALTALLERLDNLERVEGEPLQASHNPFLYGTVRLPVRFTLAGGGRPAPPNRP
jgi:cytochrome P450